MTWSAEAREAPEQTEMRPFGLVGLLAVFAAVGFAQRLDPVKWSLTVEPAAAPPGTKILGRLTATIEPGWHLYGLATPAPSQPTKVALTGAPLAETVKIYQTEPKRAFDNNFNIETQTYEGKAEFLLEAAVKPDAPAGPGEIAAELRYNVCDATRCLPPRKKTVTAPLNVDPKAPAPSIAIPAGFSEFKPGAPAVSSAAAPPPNAPKPEDQGIGAFLLLAFGAGLLAIFTPCVFPMIPITMSFFLNKPSSTRGDAVFQASVFCLGIIVLFSGIGLLTTTLLGPFGVVQLGSNPWVNAFISCVFLIFGLSLLGAFEITLPSGLLTKLDSASQRGGILGTLLMGLTFSLTSFACVGPFVGPLLAATAQEGGARPLIGMAAFATGLSAPFFLLAVFPGFLKRMPRSGGWLPRVKVVMGFIVLAAMLKYLAAMDQVLQWNLLTRERFLAAWVVLFAMAGLYLLGFLRLEGVSKDEPLGLGRLLTGALILAFAISLVPGMFGGKLGELDAYVPVASESAAVGGGTAAMTWMKNDYHGALARAKSEGKMVLVNFTGYACTNCHWMKANMFTRPEIAEAMQHYVLLELYTDSSDPVAEENQKVEDSKFKTISIPFYAILDPDEKVIASFPSATKNPQEYLDFLKKGQA
jgi:thiol:disulfide interchange protein